MTPNGAFLAARDAALKRWGKELPGFMWSAEHDIFVKDILAILEALGLIKFDEPKSVSDVLMDIKSTIPHASRIIGVLEERGFQIVRKS